MSILNLKLSNPLVEKKLNSKLMLIRYEYNNRIYKTITDFNYNSFFEYFYTDIIYLNDDLIAVQNTNYEWYVMNIKGKILSGPHCKIRELNDLDYHKSNYLIIGDNVDGKIFSGIYGKEGLVLPINNSMIGSFLRDTISVSDDEFVKLYNRNFKKIYQFPKDRKFPTDFSCGLLNVYDEKVEKWGYIDIDGNYVIKPKFDMAYSFDRNEELNADTARVTINRTEYTIDLKGSLYLNKIINLNEMREIYVKNR